MPTSRRTRKRSTRAEEAAEQAAAEAAAAAAPDVDVTAEAKRYVNVACTSSIILNRDVYYALSVFGMYCIVHSSLVTDHCMPPLL